MPFLVVGESLVDLIGVPPTAVPGGSPLNVAVGLAAAGHRVRLASELGDDRFGRLVRGHLAGHGVDLADLTTAAATNLAVARPDPDRGTVDYEFRLAWRWAGQPSLAGVDCLHMGSLGAVLEPGATAVRATVAAARAAGVPVSYDPNVRPALLDRDPDAPARIEALVAAADLVKVSSDDLAWLYPGTGDRAAAERWTGRGRRLVVVTRGDRGAVAFQGGYAVECRAPAVSVVDPVGAGDAFTAGLLSSLVRAGALPAPGRDALTRALRHAVEVAAAACTHRGATPPPDPGLS